MLQQHVAGNQTISAFRPVVGSPEGSASSTTAAKRDEREWWSVKTFLGKALLEAWHQQPHSTGPEPEGCISIVAVVLARLTAARTCVLLVLSKGGAEQAIRGARAAGRSGGEHARALR